MGQKQSSMAEVHQEVNALDEQGRTALHCAAEDGCQQTMLRLIKAGADVEAQTLGQGSTPLHLAAAAGHAALLPFLITPTTLDGLDHDNCTPLQLATKHCKLEAATVLVAAGASLGGPHLEDTPLFDAIDDMSRLCRYDLYVPGDTPKLAVLLLNAMLADPGSAGLVEEAVRWRCQGGRTALHYAASSGCQELVVALLEAGADRDAVDGSGTSPLWAAAESGRAQLVPLLVTCGNINLFSDLGTNPLLLAVEHDHRDAVAALMAAGALLNVHNEFGASTLHLAAQWGDTQWARQLLEALIKEWEQQQQHSQTGHHHHRQQQQQQQQQQQDGRQQHLPASLSALVAGAVVSSAVVDWPVTCIKLLEVVLDVLGPAMAREVCQAVQKLVQDEYDRLEDGYGPVNLGKGMTWEQGDYTGVAGVKMGWREGQCSRLAEALLLGWVRAEERLHAAQQPLVMRLQRLVPRVGGQCQQQQEQEQHLEQVRQRLGGLVQEAALAAAAEQEQRALGLLAEFAALHLRDQQLHGANHAAAASGSSTHSSMSSSSCSSVDVRMWGVVDCGLRAAARIHVQAAQRKGMADDECFVSKAEVSQRACSFRPEGVYTTFLSAWVRARQQLQQLPQEMAATVVAAVNAAQQQQQQDAMQLQPQQQQHAVLPEAGQPAGPLLHACQTGRTGRFWLWRVRPTSEAQVTGGHHAAGGVRQLMQRGAAAALAVTVAVLLHSQQRASCRGPVSSSSSSITSRQTQGSRRLEVPHSHMYAQCLRSLSAAGVAGATHGV